MLALARSAVCGLIAAALVAGAESVVGADGVVELGRGARVEATDFPFAWYLSRVQAKVTEKWAGKALPGQQPLVVFEISREGYVSRLAVEKSSGNTYYDQAALRAINEAVPFPPLPTEFSAASLPVKLQFAFVTAEDRAADEERRRKEDQERLRKEEQAHRERDQLEQERLRHAEERRRREIAVKPWPEKIKQAVLDKSVQIGMTAEQVMAAWGQPITINETITATNREEQWRYPPSTYLYFRNGTLTTIQRSR